MIKAADKTNASEIARSSPLVRYTINPCVLSGWILPAATSGFGGRVCAYLSQSKMEVALKTAAAMINVPAMRFHMVPQSPLPDSDRGPDHTSSRLARFHFFPMSTGSQGPCQKSSSMRSRSSMPPTGANITLRGSLLPASPLGKETGNGRQGPLCRLLSEPPTSAT